MQATCFPRNIPKLSPVKDCTEWCSVIEKRVPKRSVLFCGYASTEALFAGRNVPFCASSLDIQPFLDLFDCLANIVIYV